jgi:hypothetical protein
VELIQHLQYLPLYDCAEHARKVTKLRAQGVADINHSIGVPDPLTLLHRVSLLLMNSRR